MKKFIFILVFAVVAMAASAQTRGKVFTVASDTLNGNETVNFSIGNKWTNDYNTVTIVALCTQVGGTSDGTLALYGSLDGTNWTFINGVGAGVLTASPKASITGADLNQITITNGLVATWNLTGAPFRELRVAGVGTAADSTLIAIKYMVK